MTRWDSEIEEVEESKDFGFWFISQELIGLFYWCYEIIINNKTLFTFMNYIHIQELLVFSLLHIIIIFNNDHSSLFIS